MFARFKQNFYFTKGERSFAAAYCAVVAMTAGVTLFIMGSVEGGVALSSAFGFYGALLSGAVAGAAAMFTARGWLGNPGMTGFARAVIGILVVAFLSSVIAGTLIRPLYGTFYAPVLLVNAFLENPWLAVSWFGVMFGAHYLMGRLTEEKSLGLGRMPRRASAELSQLSQVNLYSRHYRG